MMGGATGRRLAPVLAALVLTWLACASSLAAPSQTLPYRDPFLSVEARAEDLLARMTLEEKVGQMVQASTGSLARPKDIERLFLGSLLSGGDDMACPNTPIGWADAFDAYQRVALGTRLGIPLLYGIDSVHGFSHSTATTVFPHNIGLGAARDPALVREIGRVTALEMAGTGIRWAFAPCLAVARDERWGRTYESFGEDPALVSEMSVLVEGLQGEDPGSASSILATAKHFVADGGTQGARDQGNAVMDDAVRRVLRTKLRMGLFEHPFAAREYLADVGSSAHRAVARRAVSESMVLLKNEGGILPLSRDGMRMLVAGKNADNLGHQMGGWSITWQGGSGSATKGTTILQGVRGAVGSSMVVFDESGAAAGPSFDVAVVVIGERPYAETTGDRHSLRLDAEDLSALARIRDAGVPVVAVLVSGRPLVITEELSGWKALLAAWLPGTEGAGVADVLFGISRPTGRLPMSWPRSESQIPINVGDPDYDPLFPYGFGLAYP